MFYRHNESLKNNDTKELLSNNFIYFFYICFRYNLIIILVYKIYDNFHHDIFFLRFTFGYHQCQGNKSVVCKSFCAICTV